MRDNSHKPLTVLVNPDWRTLPRPGRFRLHAPYFPLELMYIEGALRERGLSSVMADMWGRTMTPQAAGEVLARADFVVLTTAPTYIFWRDGICDVEFPGQVLADLRRRAPRARLIVIGPQGTVLPETMQGLEFDYLIKGEPDLVVAELIDRLNQGDPQAEELPGVCVQREGRLTVHPQAAFVADMNQLPLLEYDSIRAGVYEQPSYEASRGCPYTCSFCMRTGFRGKLRLKSPERMRIELERCRAQGYEFLAMIDEIFGMGEHWLEAFCAVIQPLDFHYGIQTRTECLTHERLRKLLDSGCISIEVGLESADPEVARAMGKDTDLVHLESNIRKACELGFWQVRLFCIFGAPGETLASIAKTEAFLLRFAPLLSVQADVYPMLPLPGTAVWQLGREKGYPLNTWADVRRFEGCMANAFRSPAEVDRICARFIRKFEYERIKGALTGTLDGRLIMLRMWLSIQFPGLIGLRPRLARRLAGWWRGVRGISSAGGPA